jgi:hypothetical protein
VNRIAAPYTVTLHAPTARWRAWHEETKRTKVRSHEVKNNEFRLFVASFLRVPPQAVPWARAA